MKRWTLLAITITVLVMSLMILPMNAETTPVSKGLAYSVNPDGTTCTITGIGTCTDRNIYIPYKVDGYKVTHIGDFAFWACSSLTSVNIPDGVTSIGYNAFGGCDKLISVTMGNGVKKNRRVGVLGVQ